MSRVYFHSPSGEAELWGGERAWLSSLCNDVTTGILDVRHSHERIERFLSEERRAQKPAYPSPDYYARFSQWCGDLETSLAVGWRDDLFTHKGHAIDMFSLTLNTASRIGGNALKLAARIHGQCEIHCWTEGADRAWLAGIIDEGLATGVLRSLLPNDVTGQKIGWENVAEFLRSRDDEPVVMSYSVCDSFPNQYVAQWEPPADADLTPQWAKEAPAEWEALGEDRQEEERRERGQELWYDLSAGEQWRVAMDALRQSSGGLRLSPDNWATFHFGHGLSVLDLLATDHEERLDRALGVTTAA